MKCMSDDHFWKTTGILYVRACGSLTWYLWWNQKMKMLIQKLHGQLKWFHWWVIVKMLQGPCVCCWRGWLALLESALVFMLLKKQVSAKHLGMQQIWVQLKRAIDEQHHHFAQSAHLCFDVNCWAKKAKNDAKEWGGDYLHWSQNVIVIHSNLNPLVKMTLQSWM